MPPTTIIVDTHIDSMQKDDLKKVLQELLDSYVSINSIVEKLKELQK